MLVLPYGSAVPSQDWSAIKRYLETGGNLLVLGGRPLTIPVRSEGDRFIAGPPETAYSREIGIEHTYEAPLAAGLEFAWKDATFSGGEVQAKRVFVIEGVSRGLGYLQDSAGERVAAPVVATDFASPEGEAGAKLGSRVVMLNFEPEPGYWTSPEAADGAAAKPLSTPARAQRPFASKCKTPRCLQARSRSWWSG